MAARETEKNRAIQLDAFRQAGFENADLRLLDENAVNEMRAAVGVRLFDELYEDSVFEVTERLGAVEIALAEESLDRAARLAAGLAPAARGAGFAQVAEIADALIRCCDEDDAIAARAVGERLLRIGEESLVRAARSG